MSSEQERAELDARAKQGETVIPGGTGGKSLEAQEHLAEGKPTIELSYMLCKYCACLVYLAWLANFCLSLLCNGREEPRRADKEGAARARRVPGDGSQGWSKHRGKVWRRTCC